MLTANYIHQGSGTDPSKLRRSNKKLMEMLEKDLTDGNGVSSRSGWTASLAVNICATKGWAFQLTANPPFGYHVKRIEPLK